MSQACAGWRGDIGAYVVGALSPAETAGVIRHLRRCAACRADYQDLFSVRRWLSQLGPAEGLPAPYLLDSPPLEPARLLRHHMRRRRWIAGTGAVITAAVIAVITAVSAHPAVPGFRAFDPVTGVHGEASLRGTPTGTQIDLTIMGLPAGQRCIMVTVSRASAAVAGTWTADRDGTARITGASAISVGKLIALRVEAPSHRLLLSIPL